LPRRRRAERLLDGRSILTSHPEAAPGSLDREVGFEEVSTMIVSMALSPWRQRPAPHG
jgi:hypothetical protein